ncbi:hypothetical protein Tco_0524601 [Tanacetum coccineum]
MQRSTHTKLTTSVKPLRYILYRSARVSWDCDQLSHREFKIHPDTLNRGARECCHYSAKDDGDDTVAPRDPQPFEPRGSPCDAQGNTGGTSGNTGGNGDQGGAPPVRECTYTGFVKCNPTTFRRNDGTVELCHWLKSTESVFSINECTERNKVKFVAATLQGRAPNMFNELILICLDSVPNEKKKVEAYIRGLPENFKGETTSSKPVILNDAIRMAHTLMEQKLQVKAERVTEGNKRKEDPLKTIIVVGCVILETVCQSAIGVEDMAIKHEIVDQTMWLPVLTPNQWWSAMSVGKEDTRAINA